MCDIKSIYVTLKKIILRYQGVCVNLVPRHYGLGNGDIHDYIRGNKPVRFCTHVHVVLKIDTQSKCYLQNILLQGVFIVQPSSSSTSTH